MEERLAEVAANKDYAAQLGKAWGMHRMGNNEAAIQEFDAILSEDKHNMDALYGLGLAQRASSKAAAAVETFRRLHEEVQAALANDLTEDRFEMLDRMVSQRLAELEGNLTV